MNEEIKKYFKAGKKNLVVIYILYLTGIVAPLLLIIGAIMAYINDDVKDKQFSGHYMFLLRTLYIGIVGLVTSLITTPFFIGPVIYALLIIWFVVRIIWGLKCLMENVDHPHPQTLWIK